MSAFRRFYGLLLLIIFLKAPAQQVQNDIYTSFVNLTSNDGISNPLVHDLYQDVFGYMWIATEEGLNRYDGYTFVIFRVDEEDSTSISNNIITSVTGDSLGNLWIGTTNGLNFYDRKSGRFTRYYYDPNSLNTIRSNHIRQIFLQNDSLLWIETLDGTLSELNLKNKLFNHYLHQPVSQPYYRYHVIWVDTDGEVWVGGRNIPITLFNTQQKTFRFIEADNQNPLKKRDNDLTSLLKTKNGDYYMGGIDGFYQYHPQTDEFTKLYDRSTFSLKELENSQILIGAGDGLMIYDPDKNTRTVYTHHPDNPQSLVNNSVTKVLIDKNGNIWIGTEEGISILNRQESIIKNYFHIPGNDHSLSGNRVSSILQDRNGRIWIGTEGNGLNRWDTLSNEFIHYRHDPKNDQTITSNHITKIYEDKNGVLWIGLWSGTGFNRFNPETGQFKRFALNYTNRKQDWYNDILEDYKGNFWMGIWGGLGVQQFDRKNGKYRSVNFWSLHIPLNHPIKNILSDGKGNIFLQTDRPFIYRYNAQKNSFTGHVSKQMLTVDPDLYKRFNCDLPVNFQTIFDIGNNGKGLTLLATDKGLLSYSDDQDKFTEVRLPFKNTKQLLYQQHGSIFWLINDDSVIAVNDSMQIVAHHSLPDSLTKLSVTSYAPDSMGTCFLVADQGLYQWNLLNGTLERLPWRNQNYNGKKVLIEPLGEELLIASPEGLGQLNLTTLDYRPVTLPGNPFFLQNLNCISPLGGQNILLVSSYGLAIFNSVTRRIHLLSVQSDLPDMNFLNSSVTEFQGRIFLAANNNLFELDTIHGKLIQLTVPDQYMVSSRLTNNLAEDSSGYLWIGTSDNGLNRLNLKTGYIDHYFSGNQPGNVPDKDITALYIDPVQRVWIGTNKGLCRFDEQTGTFIRLGLDWKAQRIRSMISSSDSILWIGTTNGLIRYNVDNSTCQQFTRVDGLPTEIFNRGASLLQNGLIAMATNHGFITFNPEKLYKKDTFSPVEFTGFSLFDQPVDWNIKKGDTLKLRYNNNFFTIGFSSLKFKYPATHPYVYQLSGMGDRWITTTEPEANFTDLAPGRYLFSVTLQGFQAVPGSLSQLVIVITPPFWKTTWFWVLNLLLAFGILLIILLGYIRQLKMNERNILLEQKLLAAQMNPHFIFNTLTAIQSFMYGNEPETAGNYLADFSRLVRLILENSRSEWISFEKEVQTLKLYLGLQQLRFANKFDYEIEIDPRVNRKITYIPPMLTQPFIENSIEHGVMHRSEKGSIFITFKPEGELLMIEVVDDGIGLKQSKLLNKHRESHTSFATSITRERLSNLQQRLRKKAGITVEDRSETEGVQGTRVVLRIPYRIQYPMGETTK